tara:strand:+ start:2870 stop:3073 length:204 start_codon:yes stop_codon:yes gene_type:complete
MFTMEQLERIEGAYEQLLLIMEEQDREHGEVEFSAALEEAVSWCDLPQELEQAVVDMYDNNDEPCCR